MSALIDTIKSTWDVEEPHWMAANEDCMGNPTSPYWRVFGTHKATGKVRIGFGSSKELAIDLLAQRIAQTEGEWHGQM